MQDSSRKSSVALSLRTACLGIVLLGLSSGAAVAQTVTEFSVGITAGAGPRGITAGPDGNLWFTESTGNRIGRITPSGVVTEFSAGITAGANVQRITAGPDGNVWFVEDTGSRIGRITPSGVITEFTAGITPGADPFGITLGSDGNLWFAEQANRIGRITPAGVVIEFSSGITAGAGLRGITAGPDGNLWFTESNANRIGRITTSGIVTEFSAGITAGANLQGITAGLDGNLWFTEATGNRIGRITLSGVVTEFSAGISPGENIVDITSGPDGSLWFPEQGDRIGKISTTGLTAELGVGITAGSQPRFITAGPDGNLWFTEATGNRIGRVTTGAHCNIDATTLCLSADRFKVTAHWATADSRSGSGQAVQLTTDTGYFWFFGSSNVEMVIKVLNGCGINQRFWAFSGGLTDVQVDLTVTDTLTGIVKTYQNPQNTPFQPIQDTSAFQTCTPTSLSPIESDQRAQPPRPSNSDQVSAKPFAPEGAACPQNTTTLCLSNRRFKVQAHWATADGGSGEGQAIPLTGDTGYFWFFSSANVEMIVKVLDGCPINGEKWVFEGGLTNVNVVVTVTDMQTGAVRTYTNPQNTAFQPIQDTSAFVTCP